jgi:hypothetical protein
LTFTQAAGAQFILATDVVTNVEIGRRDLRPFFIAFSILAA